LAAGDTDPVGYANRGTVGNGVVVAEGVGDAEDERNSKEADAAEVDDRVEADSAVIMVVVDCSCVAVDVLDAVEALEVEGAKLETKEDDAGVELVTSDVLVGTGAGVGVAVASGSAGLGEAKVGVHVAVGGG